jgi:beta-lactam-binding protein with PASTA domain
VPDVVGLTQAEATTAQGSRVHRRSGRLTSTEPKDTVTGQTPTAGETLQQGATVFITVSTYEPSSAPTSPPTSEPTSPVTSLPTSPPT